MCLKPTLLILFKKEKGKFTLCYDCMLMLSVKQVIVNITSKKLVYKSYKKIIYSFFLTFEALT